MKQVYTMKTKYIFFGIFLLWIQAVSATDKIKITLEFTPDIESGKHTFEICARCHLPEAWGNEDGTYPELAGQHTNVLVKQILAIRSGKRHSPLMYPFVQQRTLGGYQDISNVVAYISTLPMNPLHSKGPWYKHEDEYKAGEKIYKTQCIACHGDHGQGNNEKAYPKLHGQHYQYLLRQLQKVKNNMRQVDPVMQQIVLQLNDKQIEQVINYISYLPVDKDKLAPSTNWRNPDFKE